MRRESSTVVALVGEVSSGLLASLAASPNVSVARVPRPGAGEPAANSAAASGIQVTARPAWQAGAEAMREAARRRSTYVIVPDDPLAGVAAGWRAMWDLSAGLTGPGEFELAAADVLAAWRGKQFELPDYYLVLAPAAGSETGPDLYLGPLRGVRPRRVAVAVGANGPAQAARVLDGLRSLEHGPWWPPLDELLDAARRFNAGGLAEAQSAAS
jgi:hypothetical protein